jgi:hypothetical protein
VSGWADNILIHKQASLKAMNPERPFYLLDDGARPALSTSTSSAQAQSKWSVPPPILPDAKQVPGAAAAAGMGVVLADIIRGENGRLPRLASYFWFRQSPMTSDHIKGHDV